MGAEVIYGMSEGDYHSLSRLSASLLKTGHYTESLKACREYLQGKSRSSTALREGWLAHMRVNSRKEWDDIIRCPERDLIEGIKTKDGNAAKKPKQTKEYSRRLVEWEMNNPGKMFVSDDEMKKVLDYEFALVNSDCYTECSSTEVVVLFDFFGVPAKCRVDGEHLLDQDLYGECYDIYDWKFVRTTKNFNSQCWRYGWHMQAAFYKYAYEEAGRLVRNVIFAGVDKSNPYPEYTVCAPMSGNLLKVGLNQCKMWCDLIEEAKRKEAAGESNAWPAVISPEEWTVPYFAKGEKDE